MEFPVMRYCSRLLNQGSRIALAAAIVSACTAEHAWAQQNVATVPLNLSGPVYAAADAAAQATPAQSDSAVLIFFRNTEVSGFVDAYYSYNVNKPSSSRT